MAPRQRRPPARPPEPGPPAQPNGPSLVELERFSHASLKQWLRAGENLGRLQGALYFGLESARQEQGDALVDALRAGAQADLEFKAWSRIVDVRFSLRPLSVAGSLKREGGRFNIGRRLNPASFTPFPALYLGEDYGTAYQEKFGQAEDSGRFGLSGHELALRTPTSFAHFRVHGRLELVLDLGKADALAPFVGLIKTFTLPRTVGALARKLGLRHPPGLIRTVAGLQRQLLNGNWRVLPMHYDLPANPQVFGRMAAAAGLHGILYPSARASGKRCLALFPQNWAGSGSFVEVSDPVPDEARVTRLDGTTGAVE